MIFMQTLMSALHIHVVTMVCASILWGASVVPVMMDSPKMKTTFVQVLFNSLSYINYARLYFTDIDECNMGACVSNGVCTNTEGSYQCDCNEGFFLNSSNICAGDHKNNNIMLFY